VTKQEMFRYLESGFVMVEIDIPEEDGIIQKALSQCVLVVVFLFLLRRVFNQPDVVEIDIIFCENMEL
jgi:hypothetical protein